MLLTKEQQEIFEDSSVSKFLEMNFYENAPTFLYPNDKLFPGKKFPGEQKGTSLVRSISGRDIVSQSTSLTESICNTSTLKFGSVTANKLTASVNIDIDTKGLYCELIEKAEDISLPLFYGVVDSVKHKTAKNRDLKSVTCYDILYSYLDLDITDWYNALTFPMTILELRTKFASSFGLDYEDCILVNDSLLVNKYDITEKLTARNLLKFICEINGVFANVNRYQQVVFLSLTPFTLVYPNDEIFPSDDFIPGIQSVSENVFTIERYKPSDYGEYRTKEIDRIEVYDKENNLLGAYGEGDNIYVIKDNYLTSTMSMDVLNQAIKNMFDLVSNVSYVPISISMGAKPFLEVGDIVQFPVGNKSISSFILQRTLKGLTSDKLEAKGEEYHNKKYQSESEDI